ncbi:unannotated protein [freshwater metagenome]|uniref:Unannotated protein n=1 Tax=freshwater metagenome TaxID=449393 RepID=A0A6J6EZL0_9ZZZZ
MKPNGLVAAASIARHTSTPMSRANIASSFTSAMFTWRNVFSSSFTSSASAGDPTGTVVSTSAAKKPSTAASEPSSAPLVTFGVFTRFHVGLPGSMRSGE